MGSVFPGNGAAGLGYGASPTEDIRTVFITGFPPDVRDRELHNLCCLLPGYEASQLSYKGGQPQGFALFVSAAHAMQAVEALVGLPFDLRAEMAHKNMYIRVAGLQPSSSDNFSAQMQLGQGSGVAPGLERGMSNAGLMSAGSSNMAAALGTVGFMPVSNRGDNPPCNTLFIGNLSDQVSEMELMTLFSAQAGFRQMKLVRGPKQVSCFVEFEDVMSAAAVHATYQGAVLPSSERGGIRIQYSKNPFGRRQVMDM
ncbi:hypothetical protein V8C86DRAFT_1792373 [Haematococcus lacustris]